MIVTPFGQLNYGNENGLVEWVSAHHLRHIVYQNELLRQGTAVYSVPLDGKVNADWFGRHILMHIALNNVLTYGATPSSYALTSWKDEKSFYSWHDLHNLLHRDLDNALNLT